MIFVFLFFCFLVLSLFLGEELSSYSRLSKKTLASAARLLALPHKKKRKKTHFFLPSW